MKQNKRKISIAAAFAAFFGVLAACTFTVDNITLPDTIQAGEDVQFTAKLALTNVQSDETSALVVGVLVPKEWNASDNLRATFTTEGRPSAQGTDVTDGTLHVVGASEVDPQTKATWTSAFQSMYGSCGNYGLTEWVVLKSDKEYVIGWSENYSWYVNVTFTLKAPQSNDSHYLAVAYCGTTGGFQTDDNGNRYSNALTARFNVTGGVGRNDYTVPPTVSTTPLTFSYEDIFSVDFVTEAAGVKNDLYGESNIYLMASCTLDDGSTITSTGKSEVNLMKNTSGSNYHKYIYPRSFLGVPDGKTIESLKVWFENANGSKKVDNGTFLYDIKQNGTLLVK